VDVRYKGRRADSRENLEGKRKMLNIDSEWKGFNGEEKLKTEGWKKGV